MPKYIYTYFIAPNFTDTDQHYGEYETADGSTLFLKLFGSKHSIQNNNDWSTANNFVYIATDQNYCQDVAKLESLYKNIPIMLMLPLGVTDTTNKYKIIRYDPNNIGECVNRLAAILTGVPEA